MIISKTPLRISFAGGGSDLRSYYKYNKYGAVLSTSIDSYIYVSIKKQTSLFEKYRLNYSQTELVDDLEKIENPIIRECLRYLEIDDRLYISTIADVPASTGLGSSSSFCVGLLNALYKFKGEIISPHRLAEDAAHIECDVLRRPMGKQDHFAAALGGINYFCFNDDETVTVSPLNISHKNLKKFTDSLVMFWTGITRPSESILEEQVIINKNNTDVLNIMKDQALELSTILTEEELSLRKVGDLLNKGWEYKKTLASKISNQSIDDWYTKALNHGALGGKISGAGGGGFFTLVATPSKHKELFYELGEVGLTHHSIGLDSAGTIINEIK